VTGTYEVTEEVPDPDADVPMVTVTRTVENVEWDCHPVLAAGIHQPSASDASRSAHPVVTA
jgi:hypothetical protein